MSKLEPVDYLSEESYRPGWLEDGVTESTLESVGGRRGELVSLGEGLAEARRVYLVGSGGSYSVQHPLRYVAERFTLEQVYNFSGWDFLERRPRGVDGDALVVLISQSGKTREVVEALEWSKERGATTLGLTQEAGSKIHELADHGFAWEARGVTLGKLMSLYYLFGGLLREKGYPVGGRLLEVADGLPGLLPAMIPGAREAARPLGLELKDRDPIFVLGGGINSGLAYQFALCTLMEMCWVHGIYVDYSEFRHGALELFDQGATALFLRSRSEMRGLEDRILGFARQQGVKVCVFDSQGLEVDNLATPFTLFIELEWLSYYLSLARNRRMGAWRFYDKVDL